MKVLKTSLKVIGIILAIIITIGIIIVRLFFGPRVSIINKISVSNYVENYLTEKYGEHNFKITGVRYNYHMTTLFDYSEPIGYDVDFTSDVLEHSFISVSGLKKNQYSINIDLFLQQYYFPDAGIKASEEMNKLAPTQKIENKLLSQFKQEFDQNCENVENIGASLNLPDNLGRIPTIEELKNNIQYYEVTSFTFTKSSIIENNEDYKNKLSEYLNKSFGGEWTIFFNPNESISCTKTSW